MCGGTKNVNKLKKETVKALREWKRTKINKNSILEAKRRERERIHKSKVKEKGISGRRKECKNGKSIS
jgi:hypothetical protein